MAMTPALATPGQLAAERLALSLLAAPDIQAAMAAAREEAETEPLLSRPRVAERLDIAIRRWVTGLILREAAGDPEAPQILWVGETTPRTWLGHTLGGVALAGDNPDAIYRHAFVDGGAVYEMTGRFPATPPAEFSIEPLPGEAGVIPESGTLTGKIGTSGGAPMLTDRGLRRDADGRFRIILGGDPPADGADHIPLPPGPVAINTRDVFSDWRQSPVPLEIRRLSPPRAPQLTDADIRARILAHLPAYVRHWRRFKDSWLGGVTPNTYKGPFGREGAWSQILAGRFSLEPGQAALFRGRAGGARYHGFHVADHWQVGFDAARRQCSLNAAQALPGDDGMVTYVIAPSDPGVANWIDTAGCLDGVFLMRWQLFPPGFQAQDHVGGYELAPLAEVAARTGLPPVSPAERAAQLQRRAAAYAVRLTT
ncbi:hypothetical protein [Phenylobacterium sp.]|uniref:hypothetical protein n=1 Tax=Phenylobacterium sp. TaxID=1871053 RepID=UPI00301C2DB5